MSSERFTYGEDLPMDATPLETISTQKIRDPSQMRSDDSCGAHDKGNGLTATAVVEDFVDNTSTHGVPRILNASRPLYSRGFWGVVTVIMLTALLYQGSKLVIVFFQRPSTTKITIETENKLEFPSVTICNLNMMRRSKIKNTRFNDLTVLDDNLPNVDGVGIDDDYSWFYDFGSEDPSEDTPGDPTGDSTGTPTGTPTGPPTTDPGFSRRRRQVESSFFDFYDYLPSWGDDDELTEDNWLLFYNLSKTADFTDFQNIVRPTQEELSEYGHQAEDFILQCSFDTVECSYLNFSKIQNIRYGNCYVFNDAHKLNRSIAYNTARTGSQYGLHLTLMVEQPEYVGVLSPESGVKVSLADPKIFAFPEDDGITASTGQATSIGITKTSIKRLRESSEKSCVSAAIDQPVYHLPDKYDYSQRSCTKLCLQTSLLDNCGCVSDFLIDGDICSPINDTQVACREKIMKKFLKNELGCDCDNPCSESIFHAGISTALWPAQRYQGHLYQRLSKSNEKAAKILTDVDQSRRNLVRLKVFYEELNFEQVVESPLITVEALFGGVGGLMGLYIGMSFISLIEIFVFAFDLLRALCRRLGPGPGATRVKGLDH